MNEQARDAAYVAIIVSFITAGAYLGGAMGYNEEALIGLLVGGLAGGFVGLAAAIAISALVIPLFFAVIVLGPIALIIVAFHFYSKS